MQNLASRVFIGAILAVSLCVPSVVSGTTPPVSNFQGLWWNSPAGSESGWGINFAHQGDVIFASWFTYDSTGKALWLTMTANLVGTNQYAGTLYQTAGPAFSAVPFNPALVSVKAVGSGTLTFSDLNNGSFSYTVNGTTQTKMITRQVFGPLPTCTFGARSDLTSASNFQDLWWAAPAGAESGWGVNFTHQGNTIFATWFSYDVDGTPLWLSATASQTGVGTYSGMLYRTKGPSFDSVPFLPADVAVTAVGTLTLTFSDGNTAAFAYTVNGITQSKTITRQVFRGPGTVCQYAEGAWNGTTSLNETVLAVVLEGGTYYILHSQPGSATDAGVIQGTAGTDDGAFLSSDGIDFPIAQAEETDDRITRESVAGNYTPFSALQLTISDNGGDRSLAGSFVADSAQPGDLAGLAGTYSGISGHVGGRRPGTTFALTASGTFSGHNDICAFSGTMTPRRSFNAFDWTISASGASTCIFGRGPLSGVMYYDAGSNQVHGFALFPDRSDLFYLIGTKQ